MPDRYSDSEPVGCRDPDCRKGWLPDDDDGLARPCLICKPHLATTRREVHDFAERTASARAQEAIDRHDAEES